MQGENWVILSNTNFANLGKINLLIGKIEVIEYFSRGLLKNKRHQSITP